MNKQDWQAKAQNVAASDTSFAAGLLVAQLLQVMQKLSDEIAALKAELNQWRTKLTPLLEITQHQIITETLAQTQVTLTAVQQLLARQFLEMWQQWLQAPQAVEWASRTMGYAHLLRQLVADAESATEIVQFARNNSVRLEELARTFTLPEADEKEISWLKPILEVEGERVRNETLRQLERLGIVVRLPELCTPFDSNWQSIVGGIFTDNAAKHDTVAEACAPAIIVNGEVIISAKVRVWKLK